jgi:hypothetical protein
MMLAWEGGIFWWGGGKKKSLVLVLVYKIPCCLVLIYICFFRFHAVQIS